MRPLGNTYSKNGFTYELVTRRGKYAIFQQRLRPGVGCLAFEVIEIVVYPEREMFGRHIEAAESPPPTESWGRKGWTYPTEDAARAKLHELLAREADEIANPKPKRGRKKNRELPSEVPAAEPTQEKTL